MNINLSSIWNNQKTLDSIDFPSKSEDVNYLINKIKNNSEKMSEDDKAKMYARIEAKLKAGKKLSPEERYYLQKTNTQMYLQYQRIRAKADAMASQLKEAKSKQQVNDIITTSMSSISDNDPCKEYVQAAMNEVVKEFKSSQDYGRLPDKDSVLEKKKKKQTKESFEKDIQEQKEFDPMSWSPLQDMIDVMPTFNVPV